MASIVNDPNGRRRLLVVCPDNVRRTIRLGKISRKGAESVRVKVEAIVSDLIVGRAHDDELSRWIRDMEPALRAKLERAGLVRSSASIRRDATLKQLIDEFFASSQIKASTLGTYRQHAGSLLAFFGDGARVREIDTRQADQWRAWLKGEQKLAGPTISRRVKFARQLWRKAVKWRMADENPFADIVAGKQSNRSRMYFVTREVTQRVLDAATDEEFRLIIALSRYGGLRCPSEHLALRWSDVDWEHNRITVTSPKTAHVEGKNTRVIPLFPELRPLLLSMFESAGEGADHVITRYRTSLVNLRTRLMKTIKRAGLKPWPRLFQNLRSSRQTELSARFPIQAVCAWIGNSPEVALQHYLQLIEEHFQDAIADRMADAAAVAQEAAQNPAQQMHAQARTASQAVGARTTQPPDMRGVAKIRDDLRKTGMTPTGFELSGKSLRKSHPAAPSGAKSGARSESNQPRRRNSRKIDDLDDRLSPAQRARAGESASARLKKVNWQMRRSLTVMLRKARKRST